MELLGKGTLASLPCGIIPISVGHSVSPMYINFDSTLTTYKNITAPCNL